MNILTVQNLRKVYPGKKPFVAVDDVSFDLRRGEILGLLGSNGAGKTTTIQMLLGTLKPTSGEIAYFGKPFKKHRSEILKQVVFASTYVSLPWPLTVKQNLEVFGRLYGLTSQQIRTRMDDLLDRFGIMSKKESEVSRLSAGQISRLVLVKAFMVRPRIILLDEPTASLDPDMAKEVCDFVLDQRDEEGTSVLFTSHNMAEVAAICDRALFIQHGKIIADDIPENLAKSVSTSRLQLILGDGLKRTVAIAERLNFRYQIDHRTFELELDEKEIARFLSALAAEGVIYTDINIQKPTLEDFFLHIVEKARNTNP